MAYTPLLAAGLSCLLLSGVGGALVARSQTELLGAFSGWGREIARIHAGAGVSAPQAGADASAPLLLGRAGQLLLQLVLPWLGLGVAIALGASVVQVGLRWAPRALGGSRSHDAAPSARRRPDPAGAAGELVVLALAVLVCLGTLAVVASGEVRGLVALLEREPARALELFGELLAHLLRTLGLWLCVLAAFDWARRRQALLRSLRMTRSELEREKRELEADPRLRRHLQRAWRTGADGPPS